MGTGTGKPEIIHRRQLFDGRATAEEVHAKIAWHGAKCQRCGGPPVIHARVFWPLDEVMKRPDLSMMLLVGKPQIVTFKMGRHVRYGDFYACKHCRRELERVLAKGPSWAVVEWDRGPGPEKPIVQVR